MYMYTHMEIQICCFTMIKKKSRPVDSVPGNSTTPPEAPAWRSRPLALEPSVTASELPWQSPIAVGSRVLGECGGRACWETQSLWCKGNRLAGSQTNTVVGVVVSFFLLAPGDA